MARSTQSVMEPEAELLPVPDDDVDYDVVDMLVAPCCGHVHCDCDRDFESWREHAFG